MNDQIEQPRSRADFIGIAAAFIGTVIAVVGAVSVYTEQARISVSTLWPLPGLVLLLWTLLGVIGLLAAFLGAMKATANWLQGLWFISGAFIPIIVLGAFSIGPYALITFLLFLISALLLAFTRHPKWLVSFGWLVMGAVLDLGLLLLIISLGTPNY